MPKVGQNQVSKGVSVLCWHAAHFSQMFYEIVKPHIISIRLKVNNWLKRSSSAISVISSQLKVHCIWSSSRMPCYIRERGSDSYILSIKVVNANIIVCVLVNNTNKCVPLRQSRCAYVPDRPMRCPHMLNLCAAIYFGNYLQFHERKLYRIVGRHLNPMISEKGIKGNSVLWHKPLYQQKS